MFNKEKFGATLKEICNSYSNITGFAKKIGFDRSYVSKYIHQRLINPPKPKTLEKIANGSKGIVTYEELMRICGYIITERTSIEDEAIEALKRMVENQEIEYSLVDIVLNYIKKLEGKRGDEIADNKK